MRNRFIFAGPVDLLIKFGLLVIIVYVIFTMFKLMKQRNLYLKQISEELWKMNNRKKE